MCPPHFANYRLGYCRVSRPVVRRKRIHAFAAERWADAKSPAAMRFWKRVMDACIDEEIEWHPSQAWIELMRHYRGRT
jgi:hypothetical protein